VPRHKASVQEIRLGALYQVGARLRLVREELVELMTSRTSMDEAKADQLVAHWFTTEPFRKRQTEASNDLQR
jgi:hypothetical protein